MAGEAWLARGLGLAWPRHLPHSPAGPKLMRLLSRVQLERSDRGLLGWFPGKLSGVAAVCLARQRQSPQYQVLRATAGWNLDHG